jgi:hypothetical protein
MLSQAGARLERRQDKAKATFVDEGARISIASLPTQLLLEGRELGGNIEAHRRTSEAAGGSLVAAARFAQGPITLWGSHIALLLAYSFAPAPNETAARRIASDSSGRTPFWLYTAPGSLEASRGICLLVNRAFEVDYSTWKGRRTQYGRLRERTKLVPRRATCVEVDPVRMMQHRRVRYIGLDVQ